MKKDNELLELEEMIKNIEENTIDKNQNFRNINHNIYFWIMEYMQEYGAYPDVIARYVGRDKVIANINRLEKIGYILKDKNLTRDTVVRRKLTEKGREKIKLLIEARNKFNEKEFEDIIKNLENSSMLEYAKQNIYVKILLYMRDNNIRENTQGKIAMHIGIPHVRSELGYLCKENLVQVKKYLNMTFYMLTEKTNFKNLISPSALLASWRNLHCCFNVCKPCVYAVERCLQRVKLVVKRFNASFEILNIRVQPAHNS